MTGFSKQDAIPGMAHFRGSGPVGKTCADCAEFDPCVKTTEGGCKAFYRTTRKTGLAFSSSNAACQKFVAKAAPALAVQQAPNARGVHLPGLLAPTPARPSLPKKTCAMPTCKRPVDSWAQFCAYHWFGLPDTHQQRVTAARKEEASALADAVTAAVRWLQTEGERP